MKETKENYFDLSSEILLTEINKLREFEIKQGVFRDNIDYIDILHIINNNKITKFN